MTFAKILQKMIQTSPRVDLRIFKDKKGSLSLDAHGWQQGDKNSAYGTAFSLEVRGNVEAIPDLLQSLDEACGSVVNEVPFTQETHRLEVEDEYWVKAAEGKDTFLVPVLVAYIPREKFDPPGDNTSWKVFVDQSSPVYTPMWKVTSHVSRTGAKRMSLVIKGLTDSIGRDAAVPIPFSIWKDKETGYLSDILSVTVKKEERESLQFQEISLCYLGGNGKYARVVDPLPYSLGSQYNPEMLKKYPLYYIVKRLPSANKETRAVKKEELKIPE